MNEPSFTIERWPHGWTISGKTGVPMSALGECQPLFPKGSVIAPGVVHHLRYSGHPRTVFAIAAPIELRKWHEEIAESLAQRPAEERWWRGYDVGSSSATIFGVLAKSDHRLAALALGKGAVPLDADDFARCYRLLTIFPEWREQLHLVGEAFPDTAWPRLVAVWPELEAMERPLLRDRLAQIIATADP